MKTVLKCSNYTEKQKKIYISLNGYILLISHGSGLKFARVICTWGTKYGIAKWLIEALDLRH